MMLTINLVIFLNTFIKDFALYFAYYSEKKTNTENHEHGILQTFSINLSNLIDI